MFSFGFGHDSGECRNDAGVMSAYLLPGHAAFAWSPCSRKYIMEYLKYTEYSLSIYVAFLIL